MFVMVKSLPSSIRALRQLCNLFQEAQYAMEDTMISAKEHMTMATVGGLVGAVLGAGIGGVLFGLPGVVATAVLAGIGGAFIGSFL
jgi:hypothetical protein